MDLRIYLGEFGDDSIEVSITEEQRHKLLNAGKANFDDGGKLFTEITTTYNGKPPLMIIVNK